MQLISVEFPSLKMNFCKDVYNVLALCTNSTFVQGQKCLIFSGRLAERLRSLSDWSVHARIIKQTNN